MEAVKNGEILPALCHPKALIHDKGPDGYQLCTSTTAVMAKWAQGGNVYLSPQNLLHKLQPF